MRDGCVALLLAMTVAIGLAGCGKNKRLVELEGQLTQMQGKLSQTESELARAREEYSRELARLSQAHVQTKHQSNELLEAQRRLAQSLQQELGDARAKLAMTERGLVLTFLDEIFFDSGKAVIKPEGMETLQKVAQVLKETVPNSPVAVEGHTDNEPIKYSSWRSNWELSTGRALAVLHYFVDAQGIDPKRMRAVGVGEHQPVQSNDTPEGRRQNRRVEVVILPNLSKEKPSS